MSQMSFKPLALLTMGVIAAACTAQQPPYEIVDDTIPMALTNETASAERGKNIFAARDKGHCVLCHQINSLDVEFQGNIGPDLSGIAERLTSEQLRLRLVDYDAFKPGTVMPSYYRTHNLNQVADTYKDQTILSAQDIEDIIAYLMTLPI